MSAFKLLAASQPDLSMLTVESAESTGSWSLRRQPRKAHHLAPHCGFLGGEGCGLGWRPGEETRTGRISIMETTQKTHPIEIAPPP
jgi:hypothetical protein